MSGLPWFRFYPQDFLNGTDDLSDRAVGVYIRLLARMYDLGRSLDHDERELCRFLRYRDRQQLRPVLGELIAAGKITVADGKLSNDRFEREMGRISKAASDGRKGGRPMTRTAQGHPPGPLPGGGPGTQPQGGGFEENHGVDRNPPDPESDKKNTGAKGYRFAGKVVRLNERDFTAWQSRYHAIADLEAELWGLDEWWNREHPEGSPKRPDWWHAIPRALNKKHQAIIAAGSKASTMRAPATDYDREYRAALDSRDPDKIEAFITKHRSKSAAGAV